MFYVSCVNLSLIGGCMENCPLGPSSHIDFLHYNVSNKLKLIELEQIS